MLKNYFRCKTYGSRDKKGAFKNNLKVKTIIICWDIVNLMNLMREKEITSGGGFGPSYLRTSLN